MSTHAHPDTPDGWADSVADWAESHADDLRYLTGQAHRAQPLPAERQWVAPQGRPAWPARRCSPELARESFGGCDCSAGKLHCDCCGLAPVIVDRLPEDYDACDSADGEVMVWLLKGLTVIVGMLFCAWIIAGGPNA